MYLQGILVRKKLLTVSKRFEINNLCNEGKGTCPFLLKVSMMFDDFFFSYNYALFYQGTTNMAVEL